ncbi:hypothetical protein [Alteromonas sp.]|uniref:hypothetical protein n=1 Tax=Alteromonas sp. TaxID=232 RepID=UPI00257D96FD|nr:hypothetical protein [Alteromonas sp.]
MDLMIADDSPSEVSDAIKNALYQKAAERIEFARPYVADAMFGLQDQEDDETDADEIGEIDNELETEEDE